MRAPFLDTAVVEFVMNLPYDYKFRRMKGKYILKRLMQGRLPTPILQRRKQGFAVPVGKWLRDELKPLTRDVLSKAALERGGLFNYAAIERLLKEHEDGVADHRKKIWTLLVFQLWYQNWGTLR